jgi:Pyridoxamine 5'-phosphate oxidase
MAKFQEKLNDSLINFIKEQHIYFTGTAPTEGGRVNVSPKGMDSFRVLDENTVAYLDLTGSGNETSAHIHANGRMTIMFCSFSEMPLILRLYGTGEVVKKDSTKWLEMSHLFPNYKGSRQLILLHIEFVQTSCGFGVPVFEHMGDKNHGNRLKNWEHSLSLKDYWKEKNQKSIDGLPTHILD